MTLSVAALIMVRNERHVIATCIGHLLTTIGVDRVYVVDNGSSDGTLEILHRIARTTARVVVHSDDGAFRQGEIVTALAQRATADGATWLLPTDADEFLWLRPGQSLATLCQRDDIGGYRIDVCNFMQTRFVRRDGPGALATMCVAAIPAGSPADGQAWVTAGTIPFIRIAYPSKVLLRADPSLTISFGNHDATGMTGPLTPLTEGVILHAPMRSFDRMQRRAEAGRRAQIVTPEPNQSWHVKRIAAMNAEALEADWRANTYPILRPALKGIRRWDRRLSRIGTQQASFRRQLES